MVDAELSNKRERFKEKEAEGSILQGIVKEYQKKAEEAMKKAEEAIKEAAEAKKKAEEYQKTAEEHQKEVDALKQDYILHLNKKREAKQKNEIRELKQKIKELVCYLHPIKKIKKF